MILYPDERIALFIDGANLYATAKALGFDIDYKRLLALFRTRGRLVRAIYYTALADARNIPRSARWSTGWTTTATWCAPSRPKNSPMRSAAARSRATWTSSLRSMPCVWPIEPRPRRPVTGDGDFRAAGGGPAAMRAVASAWSRRCGAAAAHGGRTNCAVRADQFIDLERTQGRGRPRSGGARTAAAGAGAGTTQRRRIRRLRRGVDLTANLRPQPRSRIRRAFSRSQSRALIGLALVVQLLAAGPARARSWRGRAR